MGIWDYINSATATISSGVTRSREIARRAALPDLTGTWQNTRDLASAASESAMWTRQAVMERMPDRDGWERIGRLGLKIADHVVDHGTKPYTYGIPVYKFVKEELRKDSPQERPLKDKKEINMEFATLIARIDSLEKENMELQELKAKMETLEKKLLEINQDSPNHKTEKRTCSPPEPFDLI